MIKHDSKLPLTRGLHPMVAIPVIALFSIGSMIVFSQIALLLINRLYGIDQQEFEFLIQQPQINEVGIWSLYIFQALSIPIGGFIVGPLLYILLLEKHPIKNVFSTMGINGTSIILTGVIVISFIMVIVVVLRWNMGISLPEFMEGFERWAQQKEEEAAHLVRNLTVMPTFGHFMVAMLVIAILPAIGEELVFRGMIQNKLYAGIGNIHWAIWITGILFSAIHFQFYGFFPRMLLGVLFGYMYYWSGNLWIPILAHFINNGLSIIALYLNQRGMLDYDLEHPPVVPVSTFIISLILSIGLIWYFYQYHVKLLPKNTFKENN